MRTRRENRAPFIGGYPSLYHQFALEKVLTGRVGPAVALTRGSNGTYFDSAGVLQMAGNGVARFDHIYSGTVWDLVGLLIEEARTNLVIRSEEFDNGAWLKGANMTVTANQAVAVDGNTTAERATGTPGADTAAAVLNQSVAIGGGTANKTFSVSAWVRSISGTSIFRLKCTHGGVADHFSDDLTATTTWQRFSYTVTNGGGAGTGAQLVGFIDNVALAGYDVYVWGYQFEEASFPTSYIKTTTASVARAADVATVSNMSWFNAAQGTLFAEARFLAGPTLGNFPVVSINDGTNNEAITLEEDGAIDNKFGFTIRDNDGYVASAGIVTPTAGTLHKGVVAYEVNNVIGAADGTLSALDTSAALPTVTQLEIGQVSALSRFGNCHIARVAYWPRRLPNGMLVGLTV